MTKNALNCLLNEECHGNYIDFIGLTLQSDSLSSFSHLAINILLTMADALLLQVHVTMLGYCLDSFGYKVTKE